MSEVGYPRSSDEVVATVAEMFVSQQKSDVAELLESAVSYIDQTNYDNWNGGTYFWALRLEIPVSIYAKFEHRLEEIENDILKKISRMDRVYTNDNLDQVTILPIASATAAFGKKSNPSALEVTRIWGQSTLKLFLSHVSLHKDAVGNLSKELSAFGVSAFVAHSDIEPSLEWRDQIEIALRSMDALAALVTPEFHASYWTDQEVGWAFGRGVLALPVILGVTPQGFLGKFQGVPGGDLTQPADLATRIVKALLGNRQTQSEMRRAMIAAFPKVVTYKQAISVAKILFQLADFTDNEKSIIWEGFIGNSRIKNAYGVPEAIVRAIGSPPTKVAKLEDDIPF